MDNGASSYRRFPDGDDSGLVEIIRDYKDGLILYLNSFTGNIHTAEELAEDTFAKLGIKRPRYCKAKGAFKTWLYTIGRNVALDFMRQKPKIPTISIEDSLPYPTTCRNGRTACMVSTDKMAAPARYTGTRPPSTIPMKTSAGM